MTINVLYAALTGFYHDTHVNVYKFDDASDFYAKNAEKSFPLHDIFVLQCCRYGVKCVANFAVDELSENGMVKTISILLAKGE